MEIGKQPLLPAKKSIKATFALNMNSTSPASLDSKLHATRTLF